QHDQGITDNLNDADGVTHRFGRRAKKCCGDADNGNSGECLQDRRRKRQHDATAPGFVIRDQIRRNHRLSVAGSGGMKKAVKERNAKQCISRAPVSLGGADQTGQRAIEFCLLGENPAREPSHFRRRRSARNAKWLRKGAVCRRDKKQNAGDQQDISCQVESRDLRQGQCTRSLFANWAPQAIVVFFSLAGISLSFLPSAKVISRGNWTSSLHFGAPTSRAGFCLSKEKSTKIVGS